MSTGNSAIAPAVAWHELECGSYAADLPLWEELAEAASEPVVEVGAGTGRVALHLARAGHSMIGIEREPQLAACLAQRVAAERLPVEVLAGDARSLAWDRSGMRPELAIAPMHVLQSLDPAARLELLGAAARRLSPGGLLALAIVDEAYLEDPAATTVPPIPDMREIEGQLYSSEPLWVQVSADAFTVRRLRQRVEPGGEIQRELHDDVLYRLSPGDVEGAAAGLGFGAAARRHVSSGRGEADSIVVILEAQ